ncbi:MAG: recombinase A [Candidatus Hydrogenedentes bacterium]|nr:recombinase A [Candidatus Hydrogenedentota bacterium]
MMMASALPERSVESVRPGWSLDTLAGRLVEVSGGAATAALSASAALILQAQQRGELAAWIGGGGATFFPPDFAASGIDLEALPVVRVADAAQASKVADTLLRSGGFALVVLDLGGKAKLPLAVQTRLVGLAKKHRTALLVITRKNYRESSGGSLASLRGETEKRRAGHDCFLCELRVVKDKRRVPGWRYTEMCRGPDGLC